MSARASEIRNDDVPSVRELFDAALLLPADDREAYVRERGRGFPELIEEVLALLAHAATQVGDGLDRVAQEALREAAVGYEGGAATEVRGSSDGSHWAEFLQRLRAVGCNYARYEEVGDVGEGGQGLVVHVKDTVGKRDMALKRLLERREDAMSGLERDHRLGRFLNEAQVQSQLDHPAIVPVHEIGIDDRGRVYFAMKLVKGVNLESAFEKVALGEERWTRERALQTMVRVCEAMAYAHSKKVVHRDLKPANVMVGRFGEVFVMDWGLARVLGEPDRRDLRLKSPVSQSRVASIREDLGEAEREALVTMDSTVLGTPFYMPLEQAEGRIEAVSERSDVYAVGAMLYRLLAGRAPYERPGARVSPRTVLAMVLQGEPVRLETVAKVPAALVSIVERAMSRDAAARYPTMEALADDLRAYLEGRVVRAHGTGPWQEAMSFIRRNRWASAVATVAVLLVGAAVVAMWREQEATLVAEQGRVREAELRTKEAREAESSVRYSEHRQAQAVHRVALRLTDEAIRRSARREAVRSLAEVPGHVRGFEWRHFKLRASPLGEPIHLLDCTAEVVADVSPNLKTMVYSARRGFGVLDVESQACFFVDVEVGFGRPRALVISADGRMAAMCGSNSVQVLDIGARTVRRLELPRASGDPGRLAMSGDGRMLAVTCYAPQQAHLVVLDVEDGRSQNFTIDNSHAIPSTGLPVAVAKDGDRIWFTDGVGNLNSVVPLADSKPELLAVLAADGGASVMRATDLVVSPTSGDLARAFARSAWVANGSKSARAWELPDHLQQGNELRFSGDGERLLAIAKTALYVGRIGERSVEVEHEIPLSEPIEQAFAYKERLLLRQGGMIWIVPLQHRPAVSRLLGFAGEHVSSAFSPDGKCIAAIAREVRDYGSKVFLLDAHDGSLVGGGWLGNVARFSADGRTLAVACGIEKKGRMAGGGVSLASRSVAIAEVARPNNHRVVGGFPFGVNDIAFSSDGRSLFVASGVMVGPDADDVMGKSCWKHLVDYWHIARPEPQYRYEPWGCAIHVIDSESGRQMACLSRNSVPTAVCNMPSVGLISGWFDGRVTVHSGSGLLPLRDLHFPLSSEPVTCLAAKPDDSVVVIGRVSSPGGRLEWIDAQSGVALAAVDIEDRPTDMSWASDGSRLFVRAGDKIVSLFADGVVAHHWDQPGSSVSSDPVGTRLLCGDQILETDMTVQLRMSAGAGGVKDSDVSALLGEKRADSIKLHELLPEDRKKFEAMTFKAEEAQALLGRVIRGHEHYLEWTHVRFYLAVMAGEFGVAESEIGGLRDYQVWLRAFVATKGSVEKYELFIAHVECMVDSLSLVFLRRGVGDPNAVADLDRIEEENANRLREIGGTLREDAKKYLSAIVGLARQCLNRPR